MIKRLRIKFICITMAIVTVMMTLLLLSQLNATQNSLMQRNMKALEDAFRQYQVEDKPDDRPPEPDKPDWSKPRDEKPDFVKPEGEHPCFILYLDGDGVLTADGAGYYDLSDLEMLAEIYRRVEEREESTGMLWSHGLRYLRGGSE